MAWRIGLVCGDALNRMSLDTAVRYMPVWATRTPLNLELAPVLRQHAEEFWIPEPVFTLFGSEGDLCSDRDCILMLPIIEEHHPSLSKIELFGITPSETNDALMHGQGFVRSSRPWPDAIGYRKPLKSGSSGLRHIALDAKEWRSSEDVYDGLLLGLEAPAWHGHNFNALDDSVLTGGINGIEPPFLIDITNSKSAGREARLQLEALSEKFRNFEEEGCPVSMKLF